ncbi:hypothetical protein [uncultured Clostridium sp.]|jgi:Mn-dependent DtxR family transcriptional regulator|uniref:hypothetical protein n=1 Tax=uncultured Clostridium sp. TaxID=59620 RepID=UPI00261730E8|nr:hypothetical protein [uncultured Clostridium sp.]MCI9110281.1 hypothetical protein [Bacilli bacterium]
MRETVAIREDIIKDKNVTSEDYRLYTYLLFLERKENVDVEKIAKELSVNSKQVLKSIVRLAELGYTRDLECLN